MEYSRGKPKISCIDIQAKSLSASQPPQLLNPTLPIGGDASDFFRCPVLIPGDAEQYVLSLDLTLNYG